MPCQLLDPMTQVGGLCLWNLNARAEAIAFVPMRTEVEPEELESVLQSRDLRLFRRQLQARGLTQVIGQSGFLRQGFLLCA